MDDLFVEPALLSFFCRQLNVARKRSGAPESGNSLITADLIGVEAGRIFEDYLRRGASAPDAVPQEQPQVISSAEVQTPQEEKVAEPATAETALAVTETQVVEEAAAGAELPTPQQSEILEEELPETPALVPSAELLHSEAETNAAEATELPTPAQTHLPDEIRSPVEEQLTEPALENSPMEPPPASAVGDIVEALSQSTEKADDIAPLTHPQTPIMEERPEPSPEPLLAATLLSVSAEPALAQRAPVFAPTTQPQSTDFEKQRGPEELPARAPEPLPEKRSPAQVGGILTRRLRFLAYGVCLLLALFLITLFAMYLKEVQKQQTEVELEEVHLEPRGHQKDVQIGE